MVSVWKRKPAACLTAAIALIGLVLPLIFGWRVLGRADISAPEAKRMLQNHHAVLVTVDPSLTAKLPESELWLFKPVMQMRDASQEPAIVLGTMAALKSLAPDLAMPNVAKDGFQLSIVRINGQ